MNETREKIMQNYIDGYNQFDIEKMTRDLDENIIFKNVQNEEANLTLNGIDTFKQQANEAKSYFESRQQKITAIHHFEDKTTIEIDYLAVLAMDFPNGLKKGQRLELKGKSIFKFRNNKIVELTDIA